MKTNKTWEDAVVGDVVRHPGDGDIGVIIKIYTDKDGTKYHSINWVKDGFSNLMKWRSLEVITDINCPSDISST